MAAFLSGCTGAPKWGTWSKAPTQAQIAAVMGRTEAKAESQAAATPASPPDWRKDSAVFVTMP
jgi:hypothetical protein